jgi:flagellar protein FliO/FliZ
VSRSTWLAPPLMLLGAAAAAAQGASATPAPLPYNHGLAGTLQMMVYLFLVVGALAGGLWFMRNWAAFFRGQPKGPRRLNIAETRMLGNRQFLIVAEYDDKKILLGVCPGRIDYLCPLGGRDDETFSRELREGVE